MSVILIFSLPPAESRSVWGDKEVRVVGCPFDGRYTFTYQRAGGAEGACPQPTSEISNCPLGFGYNVTYRDCSFSPVPISRGLQCLGSWLGEDNINYLAVRDTSATPDQPHLPRFRCGVSLTVHFCCLHFSFFFFLYLIVCPN
ncbi:hypothetical protein E2C01_061831 [Portunus trituberculatus]|uniref:DUF7042 domain-containing protein n=1 Tax=Portunus trituberculatus TaxID=210409 RepID=A0A5B7HC26_PORTR|nr:hypothetical protein [Portunus trituberculatus]